MKNLIAKSSMNFTSEEVKDSLSVRDLAFVYPGFNLGPITLAIAASCKIVGLIGPNGAGKTTLMSVIAGIIPGASGVVNLDGAILDDLGRRKLIAFTGVDDIWYQRLTFRQHLDLLRPFYPTWSRDIETDLLKRFAIPEKKSLGTASAGMRAKFALVAAFARQPNMLLFDEPWNALDPTSREEFSEALRTSRDLLPGPIIVSSHELEQIDQLADLFIFVANGRIIASGNRQNLMEDSNLPVGARLVDLYMTLENHA